MRYRVELLREVAGHASLIVDAEDDDHAIDIAESIATIDHFKMVDDTITGWIAVPLEDEPDDEEFL